MGVNRQFYHGFRKRIALRSPIEPFNFVFVVRLLKMPILISTVITDAAPREAKIQLAAIILSDGCFWVHLLLLYLPSKVSRFSKQPTASWRTFCLFLLLLMDLTVRRKLRRKCSRRPRTNHLLFR